MGPFCVEQLDSGFPINVLQLPGMYAVADPVGAPALGDYILMVIPAKVGGISRVTQTLTNIETAQEYLRVRTGNIWSDWLLGGGGGAPEELIDQVEDIEQRLVVLEMGGGGGFDPTELQDAIDSLESRVDGHDGDIALLQTASDDYETRIAALEAELPDVAADVADLTTRLDAYDLLTVGSRLTALEAADTSLGGRITVLEGLNISSRLTAAESDIDALQAADAGLDSRLDVLEAQTLNTRLTAAEGDIDDLEITADDHETRIAAAEVSILDFADRIQDLEDATGFDPTALLARVDALEAADVVFDTSIDDHETRIAALEAVPPGEFDPSDLEAVDAALDARLDVLEDLEIEDRLEALESAGPGSIELADITDASPNGRSLVGAADYAAMRALLDLEVGTDVQAYSANLTAWAALDPTTYTVTAARVSDASANGRSLLTAANYAAMRALLDLEAGTDFYSMSAADAAFQPLDANLTDWALEDPAAYTIPVARISDASANGRSLISAANYAAMRALLDLEAGTDFYSMSAADAAFQPLDSDLTAWAATNPTSYTIPVARISDATANGRSLISAADYAAMRTLLGLVIGTNVQAHSSTLDGTEESFLTTHKTKLDYLTVTANTDLDAIRTAVANLTGIMKLSGPWDASSGSFPSGSVEAGFTYLVSVSGTVDGQAFVVGDQLTALVDTPSTSTYAANWLKLDYSDAVMSVAGRAGTVTLTSSDLTDSSSNGRSILGAADYAAMRALLDLEIGTDVQAYSANLTGWAGTTTSTYTIPVARISDASANGRSLISAADYAAMKALLDLEIGTDVQAYSANLTSWAGETPSTYTVPVARISDATANGRSLISSTNYASMRALLDLEAGTDFYSISAADAAFQPLNANLTSWAAETPSTYTIPVARISDASANGRSLISAADYAAMRTALGLVIGTNVQAYSANLAAWSALDPTTYTVPAARISDASANGRSLITAADYAAMRTALGLVIGTNVQAYDADTVLADTSANLTAGFTTTSNSIGTISSGTNTLNMATRNVQHYTNNGAHTLAPPTGVGSMIVDILNGASAGAITTSGFTKVTGDAFTTVNAAKFRCYVSVGNHGSNLHVQAW